MGKADASPLEHIAVFEEPRDATPALRTIPAVTQKTPAVYCGKLRDDFFLQPEQELLDGADVHA
jgi:hypothetical protein